MRAETGFAPRAAPGHLAVGGFGAGVDGAEGGRGEGGEHARVDGDRFGDAFAACESGADELVGVGPVGFRAGRADRSAAVPARQVDHLVRAVLRVSHGKELTGGGVDVADGAAQPDWPDTASGGQRAGQPLVVVVAGGAVEQFVFEGPGARPGPRAGSVRDGDQGQRRVAHTAGLLRSSPWAVEAG